MADSPKRKFKLFDTQREGPGVLKNERKLGYDFYSYFVRMWRNLSKFISINLSMVVGNFPLLFLLIALTGKFNYTSTAPTTLSYPVLAGAILHDEGNPLLALFFAVFGKQTELSAFGPVTYVLLGLSALVIFTFGMVNAGTAYVMRNIVTGDAVFPWSDFLYAIKRNWKQALIYGILDAGLLAILCYDIAYFSKILGTLSINMMFYTSLICLVLYLVIRVYVYLMMVTFDLSIFKLLKNGLYFSLLGLGRNALALLGAAVIVALNLMIATVFPPLGIALPFLLTLSLILYTFTFVAYDKIKEIMIDPYYEKTEPTEE